MFFRKCCFGNFRSVVVRVGLGCADATDVTDAADVADVVDVARFEVMAQEKEGKMFLSSGNKFGWDGKRGYLFI